MNYEGTYKVGQWTLQLKLNENCYTGEYYKLESDTNKGSVNLTEDDSMFKGTFKDPKGHEGVLHIIFNDGGFKGKWGKGLDNSNPRGKWDGIKLNTNDVSECVSDSETETYDYITLFNVNNFLSVKLDEDDCSMSFDNEYLENITYEDVVNLIEELGQLLRKGNEIRAIENGSWYLVYKSNLLELGGLQELAKEGEELLDNMCESGLWFACLTHKEEAHHWDRNFLKLSEYLEGHIRVYGKEEYGFNFINQDYDDGEYEEGYISNEDDYYIIQDEDSDHTLSEHINLYELLNYPSNFLG